MTDTQPQLSRTDITWNEIYIGTYEWREVTFNLMTPDGNNTVIVRLDPSLARQIAQSLISRADEIEGMR